MIWRFRLLLVTPKHQTHIQIFLTDCSDSNHLATTRSLGSTLRLSFWKCCVDYSQTWSGHFISLHQLKYSCFQLVSITISVVIDQNGEKSKNYEIANGFVDEFIIHPQKLKDKSFLVNNRNSIVKTTAE